MLSLSSRVRVFSSKLPTSDQQKASPNNSEQGLWKPIWEDERKIRNKVCATQTTEEPELDGVDECSIPRFSDAEMYDIPKCERSSLVQVINEFTDLFGTKTRNDNYGMPLHPHLRMPCESPSSPYTHAL